MVHIICKGHLGLIIIMDYILIAVQLKINKKKNNKNNNDRKLKIKKYPFQ